MRELFRMSCRLPNTATYSIWDVRSAGEGRKGTMDTLLFESLFTEHDAIKVASDLRALGNEQRLLILCKLAQAGEAISPNSPRASASHNRPLATSGEVAR